MTANRMTGWAMALVLTGIGWASLPATSEAGTLDRGLLDKSSEIISHLKRKKIDTVGVLPFRVQVGSRKPAYGGAPLGKNMPTRIENALIMTMDSNESQAIGVIRGAASRAMQGKVGSYTTSEAEFKKLFTQNYDLAWGGKTVKAQGFLTGIITNEGNRRDVTQIQIDLLTPASKFEHGKVVPTQSWKFQVRTDAILTADLGYNFALARSRAAAKPSKRDEQIVGQVTQQDQTGKLQQPTGGGQGQVPTPDHVAGFAFELHYDGVKQDLKAMTEGQGAQAPIYTAPPAKPGTKVAMYLTRNDDTNRKMGALLLVNGKSSFAMDTGEPYQLRKWIYDATRKGVRDEFKGFYTDTEGKNLLEFKVLTPEESLSRASEFGNKAGWIDVFVFASGDQRPPVGPDEVDMLVSSRALPRNVSKRASLKEVRMALLKANNIQLRSSGNKIAIGRDVGGLIVNELEPIRGEVLQTDDLPNPILLGHLTIRYWEGPTKKIQAQN
ncbi:MAG: hypothetical protein U0840_15065 [Gemmataceae bacterium]